MVEIVKFGDSEMAKYVVTDFETALDNTPDADDPPDGLVIRVKSKRRKVFNIDRSIKSLDILIGGRLPGTDECIKLISFDGGFSSISFIRLVAGKDIIKELTVSTLRVGEKQFNYLNELHKTGKLIKATFYVGSIMKEDEKNENASYNYYGRFKETCIENNWRLTILNNHSKILLMRTMNNYYVLETSSNLNENPKIEQYSFENDKQLYDFYYEFFKMLRSD